MGMEEEQGTTPHRPATADRALGAVYQPSPLHSQCQCRLTCLPPPRSPLLPPDPFLAAFWSVRPLAFWKPSYLATNRMKCRENRCTIFVPAPPTSSSTPTPASFPHSSSTSTACKSFAVHPQPPWPPQRVRQRHLGHIYQNILRIQKQKFATLPPAPLPSPANAVLVAD